MTSSESPALPQRHFAHYAHLCQNLSVRHHSRVRLIAREWPDLVRALLWGLEHETLAAFKMAQTLMPYFHLAFAQQDWPRIQAALLQVAQQSGHADMLTVLLIIAQAADERGDYATAHEAHKQRLLIYRQTGDQKQIHQALTTLGLLAKNYQIYETANAYLIQAIEAGDLAEWLYCILAEIAYCQERLDVCLAYLVQMIQTCDLKRTYTYGSYFHEAKTCYHIAQLASQLGEHEIAHTHLLCHIKHMYPWEDRTLPYVNALYKLGENAAHRQDRITARDYLALALRRSEDHGHATLIVPILWAWGLMEYTLGDKTAGSGFCHLAFFLSDTERARPLPSPYDATMMQSILATMTRGDDL